MAERVKYGRVRAMCLKTCARRSFHPDNPNTDGNWPDCDCPAKDAPVIDVDELLASLAELRKEVAVSRTREFTRWNRG